MLVLRRGSLVRARVSRWACLRIDRFSSRPRRDLLRPKKLLNPRLRRIRVWLASVPVLLSLIVLLRALHRVAAPRGRVIGIRVTPSLGTGATAGGINNFVILCRNWHPSPLIKESLLLCGKSKRVNYPPFCVEKYLPPFCVRNGRVTNTFSL